MLMRNHQLYRVAVNIVWADPRQWPQFFSRLGGIYMLMSFIGCVDKLMGGSGLNMLMGKALAGVEKLLLGGKFLMNLRALGVVVIELLRDIIGDSPTVDVFNKKLTEPFEKSILADHWIKNLIDPLL